MAVIEEKYRPKPGLVRGVVRIGVNHEGAVIMEGELTEKKLVLLALAEALRIIAHYEPSLIIKPEAGKVPEETKH